MLRQPSTTYSALSSSPKSRDQCQAAGRELRSEQKPDRSSRFGGPAHGYEHDENDVISEPVATGTRLTIVGDRRVRSTDLAAIFAVVADATNNPPEDD